MKFELRPYQNETIDSILTTWKNDTNKILTSLATGLGKTVIFTHLSDKHLVKNRKKVLVIAHREELLKQAYEKFLNTNGNLLCKIDQGRNKISLLEYQQADVILASVATLGRKGTERIKIYNPQDFNAVIIDEAHRSLATTYIRIFEHFGISKHPALKDKEGNLEHQEDNDWNKECLLLGVTATPMRSKSGESLKYVFDTLAYKYDLIDAIKDGWLSNIHSLVAQTTTDISDVKVTNGEYRSSELSKKVNTDGRNQFIIETYKDKAQEGVTLVFAVDREHNQALKKRFKDHGIKAEIVDGETPKDQRKQILNAFKNDQLPVLINCEVLTEGFDAPNVMNILMARPTKSPIFYMQAIGRGTRLFPGKEKVTIIDFVDNSKHHNPMTLKYIMGIPEGSETAQSKKKKKKVEEMEDVKKELELFEEVGSDVLAQLAFGEEQGDNTQYEIIDKGLILDVTNYIKQNFIRSSRFTWFKIFEDTWFLPFPNYQHFVTRKGKIKFFRSRLKVVQKWEEYELVFEGQLMDKKPIKDTIGRYSDIRLLDARVEAMVIENNIESMFLKKGQRWHSDPASDNQKQFIMNLLNLYSGKKKLSVSTSDLTELTKGQAGILINILKYETKT